MDGDKNPLIELVSKAGSAKVWSSSESESNDLIIDLLGYKAIPSHYQLGTSIGGSPPTTFKFFGSNDNETWTKLDTTKADSDFRQPGKSKLITCNHKEPFKHFKLQEESEWILVVQQIDIYGF